MRRRRSVGVALAVALVMLSSCGDGPVSPPMLSDGTLPTPMLEPEVEAVSEAEVVSEAEPEPFADDRGAEVFVPAERDVAVLVGAECDLATARAVGAAHPDVDQLVIVGSSGWSSAFAQVSVTVRSRTGQWHCQTGLLDARVGRNGTRPLMQRRSGDGTAPAGVFPLSTVTAWDGEEFSMFGNWHNPGVRAAYRLVKPADCWGATPGHPDYNKLVARQDCPGPDDEWLPRFGDVYSHAAVIGANMDPISGDAPGEPPYAAAIFLHRHSYTAGGATRATSGCVSLAYEPLVDVLRMLDPAKQPHFAIGPVNWLRDKEVAP